MSDVKALLEKSPAKLERERNLLSLRVERGLETPMVVLGIVWLILLVLDLIRGLNPFLQRVGDVIWIVFILDYLFRFFIAPRKLDFFKRNVLTLLSLALPALRVFRVFRALRLLRMARATRSIRLVRILTGLNRGLRALGASMGRRGMGYVTTTTVLVLVTSAAGMLAFEGNSDHPAAPRDYGTALWWTAMMLTTMGSEYWPRSPEGRILCLLLSLYGFAIFGYVTAALATFFVGRDADDQQGEIASQSSIRALQREITLLRQDLASHLNINRPGDKETN